MHNLINFFGSNTCYTQKETHQNSIKLPSQTCKCRLGEKGVETRKVPRDSKKFIISYQYWTNDNVFAFVLAFFSEPMIKKRVRLIKLHLFAWYMPSGLAAQKRDRNRCFDRNPFGLISIQVSLNVFTSFFFRDREKLEHKQLFNFYQEFFLPRNIILVKEKVQLAFSLFSFHWFNNMTVEKGFSPFHTAHRSVWM